MNLGDRADNPSARAVFAEHPVIVVIRDADRHRAYDFALACAAAGATALEVTTTVPESATLIANLREELPGTLLGAGTINTSRQAREHAEVGAAFLVAPGLDPAVVRAAAAAGVPFVPGVLTPSEAIAAVGLGLDTVKLFPAGTVGPDHLRALRSVFPTLSFVPTGGITDSTAAAWRGAGASTLGLGGELRSAWQRGGDQALASYLARLATHSDES